MSSHRPAGGIRSKNVTNRPVRYGESSGARQISVKATSQLGTSVGSHVTGKGKVLRGTIREVFPGPMGGMGSIKLGNELAPQVQCKPGGSREIFKSGSQHGLTTRANAPKGRGILNNE